MCLEKNIAGTNLLKSICYCFNMRERETGEGEGEKGTKRTKNWGAEETNREKEKG